MSAATPLLLAACIAGILQSPAPQTPPAGAAPPRPGSRTAAGHGGVVGNELDAFMEKVLARRELNRRTLQEYVLDESERFDIFGPGRTPFHRTRREYTWYVRDGMHVRSPVRFNGVTVGDGDRERYEADWIRREQERRARKAKKEAEGREVAIGTDGIQVSGGAVVPAEPRFVSEAYFLEFKFEPGNYYLAGRESLDGQEVLRIEYYPTRLFGDDDRDQSREGRRRRQAGSTDADAERDIDTKMNKTALVTLWIDPAEHQIVRYTFENVWLDFLPGAWLVRVDEIRASMTMGQPFQGVWLPREMQVQAGLTLATGSFEAAYARAFSQYRLAEVETRIGPPRDSRAPAPGPEAPPQPKPEAPDRSHETARCRAGSAEGHPCGCGDDSAPTACGSGGEIAGEDVAEEHARRSGPFVRDIVVRRAQEIVGEIRVHGNAFLSDEEVLAIARVAVGDRLDADDIEEIETRLRESRRFESIDVRKRYRSLTDPADVALVLVVHERPGVRSAEGQEGGAEPGTLPGPLRRVLSTVMFLPIIGYADGYGVTYGGRASTVDLLGLGERLSVPLTWGGTRRAALEAERPFDTGPLTRVGGSVAIWSRENPRFDIRDRRVEVKGRAERVFADLLRAGVEASRSTIRFGASDDSLWTLGTSLAIDTRADPAFPANAVYGAAGWTGLHFASAQPVQGRVDLYTADARAYLRLHRRAVLAVRAQYAGAEARLPPYERLLVGGASSLRGYRAGSFDGDRTVLSSAELRVPVTSILSGARFGVTAFFDAARVWDYGQRTGDADWHRGAGAGVFLIASVVRLNLEVARGLQTGRTRVHLSTGFGF